MAAIGSASLVRAASLDALLRSLGFETAFCDRPGGRPGVSLEVGRAKQSIPPTVERTTPLEYDGFVYDLHTSSDRFAAGAGRIVVRTAGRAADGEPAVPHAPMRGPARP